MIAYSPHTPATRLRTFSSITAISSRQPTTNARSRLMYTVEYHFSAAKYKITLKTEFSILLDSISRSKLHGFYRYVRVLSAIV